MAEVAEPFLRENADFYFDGEAVLIYGPEEITLEKQVFQI